MTYEEAVNLKSYSHYCNCGGYASSMNGRDSSNPHATWCAQYKEFEERQAALTRGPKGE